LLTELRAQGVQVVGEIQDEANGRFAWILDPEGNKVELWQPVESDKDPYLPQ
jgi:predicted enzyme related to lactoylglutathione lyase